jgi:hypothetical protein
MVGGTYTRQQFQVQQAIRQHRRVVVHSGHSTGKSFVCADLIAWFMKSFPGGACKVVTTAPTWRQVKDILWKTLRARIRKSRVRLGGNLLPRAPTWEFEDEHFAEGFSTDEAEKMQGYHAKYLLVILDEAAGVSEEIWDTATRLATGSTNFILAIGNPGAPTGPFYEAAVNSSKWHTIHLDSRLHPNVVTGVELVPGAATRVWIDEMEEQYGGTNTMRFCAYVSGEFPTEGADTLIAPSWVDRAFESSPASPSCFTSISADIARYGDDETVITTYNGSDHVRTLHYNGRDLMHTAGVIVDEFSRHDPATTRVIVDADGIGAGVLDRLQELKIPAEAFHGGLAPFYRPGRNVDRRRERFLNLRAQAWYEFAEALRTEQMTLRPDRITKAQLTALTYKFTSDGKIQVERKEDLKKRMPRLGSPDRADSLVMGWFLASHWTIAMPVKKPRRKRTWVDQAQEMQGA